MSVDVVALVGTILFITMQISLSLSLSLALSLSAHTHAHTHTHVHTYYIDYYLTMRMRMRGLVHVSTHARTCVRVLACARVCSSARTCINKSQVTDIALERARDLHTCINKSQGTWPLSLPLSPSPSLSLPTPPHLSLPLPNCYTQNLFKKPHPRISGNQQRLQHTEQRQAPLPFALLACPPPPLPSVSALRPVHACAEHLLVLPLADLPPPPDKNSGNSVP